MKTHPHLRENARIVGRIPTAKLIADWQRSFRYDISRIMGGVSEITVYECVESGFRYFEPTDIAGDGEFYGMLQKYPWYYLENKWEYSEALKYVSRGQRILEVGCGEGAFIEKSLKCGLIPLGFELNMAAVGVARSKGLNVLNADLIKEASARSRNFEVVAHFQVLEHVPNPWEFLRACHDVTIVGGLIIVAVPNNSSYCVDRSNMLNLPPHHMGQWTVASLSIVLDKIGYDVEHVAIEPLSKIHINAFLGGLRKRLYGLLYPLINRFTIPMVGLLLKPALVRSKLVGHTMLVVGRKRR